MDIKLFQDWLSLQCQMIPGVSVGLVGLGTPGTDGFQTTATWPKAENASDALLASARGVLDQKKQLVTALPYDQTNQADACLHVAYPLVRNGSIFGAVVVKTGPLSLSQQATVAQLLSWGNAWLELLINHDISGAESAAVTAVHIFQQTNKYKHFPQFATAVSGELARSLSCRRVSVGFLERGVIKVRAISNTSEFNAKSRHIRRTAAAMEECLTQGNTIVVPEPANQTTQISRAHEILAEDGASALCSLIVSGANGPLGAVTMERDSQQAFGQESIALSQYLIDVLGPLIELRLRESRSLWTRIRDTLSAHVKGLMGTGHLRAKFLLGVTALLLAFLTLGTGVYRVSAPATLEGRVQRAVVAPFDGFISATFVRAGEEVGVGQVLAELDDTDLLLEQRKWVGQRDEFEREHRKALADLEHSTVRILRAQMAQAEARLQLVNEQLARTKLLAPFDGVLISGDLNRSLGAPVERGEMLFEVAPLDDYRVVLDVDEQDIPDVSLGQKGLLTLSALPGDRMAIVVKTVSGIAQADAEGVLFRVEARLENAHKRLRPGMQGVGKVDIGERRLLWIWTRRLIGWLQIQAWSLWP